MALATWSRAVQLALPACSGSFGSPVVVGDPPPLFPPHLPSLRLHSPLLRSKRSPSAVCSIMSKIHFLSFFGSSNTVKYASTMMTY